MPNFQTFVPIPEYPFRIGYQEHLLSLGSCFAEHIGRRLAEHHFYSLLNPYGILYNPVSIAQGLHRLLQDAPFQPGGLFEHQGLWHSFFHHGAFSHPTREEALDAMNAAYRRAQGFLLTANRLILTMGTAHVFVYRPSGEVVANCHKLPGTAFERRRLSPREVIAALEPVLYELKNRQPELEVIITVSPVRHIRDGLVENQRSKATLLLATGELCEQLPFAHYFPSYEIMMDELRGYRFYAADMIHPTEVAISYIWQRFGQAFFDEDTQLLMQRIEKVIAAARHRPFHPASEPHQRFLRQQLDIIAQLERDFSFLNLSRERAAFEQQLTGARR
ncbi:MAG: GSCFA domain-containing protein [Lewinellaceae bacterium]|nr:GSCFA domain-containing protein [Lewinellaceae bacterium]MCB9288876.1 GSCFA domain-containing protein [Lewinellaceae bacterium]